MSAIKREARVVVVGLCMTPDTFSPARAIVKELDLSFAFVYRKRDFEIVLDMLGHERIDPRGMVTDCVGFESFPQAFESLKTPGEQIKIMLELPSKTGTVAGRVKSSASCAKRFKQLVGLLHKSSVPTRARAAYKKWQP